MVARPQPGSSAIDLWPENLCNDLAGSDLQVDLTGVRRVGGIPIDGDGVPPANCDAGATEAPAGTAPPFFKSGFEG
jgi:hypothetical protein